MIDSRVSCLVWSGVISCTGFGDRNMRRSLALISTRNLKNFGVKEKFSFENFVQPILLQTIEKGLV